ncbi:nuclear pore complex subunit [Brumimicrobium salinarum]|uniref:Nuclear pore complex subunit n=1 Tax=Brumimicrobium salinarum TaxID=2058658 RepID=A0A2I0R2M2_9FLAO|nr:DUF1987 domain-containing protein [Brumimicrobium salinarum]PKR80805.1 nuclear pore complex subunit [Brumimicrobium salinarum]
MEILEKSSTPVTPHINFNPKTGVMLIQGRAIPQNAEEFWGPVLKWFYAYSIAPQSNTKLVFNMEYYNNSSSRQILFLLHKLNELKEQGYNASVLWKYTTEDKEMKEAGYDFSCMVEVPFEFEVVNVEKDEIYK